MAATVCCDTSFLFSLYGRDANTIQSARLVERLGQPLSLTVLNEFELLNAIRFAVYRHALSRQDGLSIIAAFDTDIAGGRIVIENCNLAQVVAEARRLSSAQTETGGHRSFDILHVAAAVHLSATLFLTFDANQRALAKSAGLKTQP